MVRLATKTILAIDSAINKDQGASFRGWLGKVIAHVGDAYSEHSFPFRSHMGASGIGNECARSIWYGFRWVTRPDFDGRLLRLFNRGHLEEARFIAMLLMIGAEVYQQDENGNQFRISSAGGHFGGSGDGIVVNIPDLPSGTPALAEFKTFGMKPFAKLVKEGVKVSKFVYYVQMQVYMKKMGFPVALFMAVNKNDDTLYGEIIEYDSFIADQFIDRGDALVFVEEAPKRLSESPGWFECKWCDHRPVCHLKATPDKNCRTCHFSVPNDDGTWACRQKDLEHELTKDEQLAGCKLWDVKEGLV